MEWGLICPFWIDTEAYTSRDQLMFCAGCEFCDILNKIRFSMEEVNLTIHRENESRIRMACGKFGRNCETKPCEEEFDPEGTWSYLLIKEKI